MSTLCPISASGTHALSKTWLLRLDQSFVVIQNQVLARQFSHSHVLQARHFVKKKPLSKGQLANIARKKALKKGKSIFDAEKMTLADAIHVLRVSILTSDLPTFLTLSTTVQSVEVASPNAAYELTVKTEMPRGAPIPKGRISFPKEPKPRTKDRILVFAEGRAAEEAKRAGADIVGGLELIDGVHSSLLFRRN